VQPVPRSIQQTAPPAAPAASPAASPAADPAASPAGAAQPGQSVWEPAQLCLLPDLVPALMPGLVPSPAPDLLQAVPEAEVCEAVTVLARMIARAARQQIAEAGDE
jgi:hypothetical protein